MDLLPRLRSGKLRSTAAVAALALTLGTLGGAALATGTATPAAAAGPVGCGFGTNGPSASTLCWLDMSSYSDAAARSAGGQAMSASLPGGYTFSYTITTSTPAGSGAIATRAATVPTYGGAYMGTQAYLATPGKPALGYNVGARVGATYTLSNLTVTDSANNTVHGWGIVAADAESTQSNGSGAETLLFNSDVALSRIDVPSATFPACTGGLTGVGTTNVSCIGGAAGPTGKVGALAMQANQPSTISATTTDPSGAEDIAFAFVTSKVTLNKVVNGRIDTTDSFDTSITSPEGSTLATATTGTSDTSSTGSTTVLPTSAGAFTLAEQPTSGTTTTLSNYTQDWSCTNATPGSTTTLPSGGGTSQPVTIAAGDDITCTVTNTALAATLGIVKHPGTPVDVNGDGITDAGDSIQYTFTVTNTGVLAMSNIGVTDAKAGSVTCPVSTLAPGASELCSADSAYTITAADVTNGSVDNSATAQGTPPGSIVPRTSTPSTTSTPTTTPTPALTVKKSADPSASGSFTVGQVITYHFAVTNSGNVPMNGIAINEGPFTGTGTMSAAVCPQPTLAVGAQEICEATYTLTTADVDSGSITNAAVATGVPAGTTETVISPPSVVTVPTPPQPAITIVKSASPGTVTAAGQAVTYSFVVTNTGNVTLQNVTVADTAFSGTGTLGPIDCPTTTLVAGQVETCTADYTATQADVDAGTLTNTANVIGTPPDGIPLPPVPSNQVVINIPRTPGLSIVKTANVQAAAAGQTITYSFVVTNTGNVTITDPQVSEGAFSGTGKLSAVTCPPGTTTLAPAAAITCTASYTVTQA
ncbi:MAG: hypothetical protein ABI130_15320, partial [Leifsonia sp.]